MKPLPPVTFHHSSPPPHLQQYVQAFWHAEGTGALTLGTIADGCPGLVFHQTERGLLWGEQKKKLSSFFLYGQTTKLSKMQTGGAFRMTGVIFYPHVMKILFGFNASEVTDDCVDLLLLSGDEGKELVHKMEDCADKNVLYCHINNYLSNIIYKKKITHDTVIQNAVIQLMQSNGDVSLKQLQQSLFITERTFERRFEQYVGISAKLFARVCRFQASLQQLRNGEYEKLSDIAFNNGYADQSHFIRAFKQFSGYSPVEFTNENKVEEVSLLLIR
ncbi:helix-turn-helix transcriptional regulator [Pseudobacter ginsenosidimutans]|uniref:AraC-like DNA-binding protein n=1 Tax=Pseudobacter ginsenosidimutans TaxID=661488 RepID=A0A4Q7MYL9_9BACT|nr:helix-turn-helix transcriptional regulator [Pseudobacter ginsenosidimutans]RZS72250.1 AraC-like DNA-binding protein [Pseudobacter ginsenosidimutans]